MKSRIFLALLLVSVLSIQILNAQEANDDDKKPVRSPYETTVLIDFPTTKQPVKSSFEFMIHHRFGKFGNGFSDLMGIYAPSNIRLGIDYGLTDYLSIGFGTEKNNKMQEFQLKWSILTQTRSGSMPISLSYFGSAVIDARDEANFGANYGFTNRFSYFNQIIISRKFTPKLTLQTSLSFSHYNAVDSTKSNDKLAWQVGGRYKLWGSNSFMFEYCLPFNSALAREEATFETQPGYSAGLEFGTSTHCFQVFVSNYDNIIRQQNVSFNQNSFFDGDILVGFNITIRF